MENFEYLPRLQAGRIVLRPAQWRITKERFSLNHWQTSWQVPRYISLSPATIACCSTLIRIPTPPNSRQKYKNSPMAVSRRPGSFPPLDELWLSGTEGRYYSELVVSVVLCSEKKESRTVAPTLSAPWTIPRIHPRRGLAVRQTLLPGQSGKRPYLRIT